MNCRWVGLDWVIRGLSCFGPYFIGIKNISPKLTFLWIELIGEFRLLFAKSRRDRFTIYIQNEKNQFLIDWKLLWRFTKKTCSLNNVSTNLSHWDLCLFRQLGHLFCKNNIWDWIINYKSLIYFKNWIRHY